MALKNGFGYRLLLVVVPWLYAGLSRLLFATCRVREHGRENLDRCQMQDKPFVALFWHYSVFAAVALVSGRGRGWAAMVSASKDAEFVARILARQGVVAVRGSRNRGGLAALKGLIGLMDNGNNAAIVGDGSQGPPRVMQAGALLLASRSGAPILPLAVAADRYWAFGSWDRTLLPKPFARLHLWYGEPMTVPEKAGSEELERCRLEMEGRLNNLYAQAWGEFGK
ncbi:MAG: lysophospholipid acyltransferase family protein, partial [Desulfobulbaceae bacterium]|nr:lysophospholipid acyltransferase family protein [Desulfobulbaceae bacterium]HIJ91703.1 lysophospholipid acyltransferase family protein [Deltaproteobacteria bacterium]